MAFIFSKHLQTFILKLNPDELTLDFSVIVFIKSRISRQIIDTK